MSLRACVLCAVTRPLKFDFNKEAHGCVFGGSCDETLHTFHPKKNVTKVNARSSSKKRIASDRLWLGRLRCVEYTRLAKESLITIIQQLFHRRPPQRRRRRCRRRFFAVPALRTFRYRKTDYHYHHNLLKIQTRRTACWNGKHAGDIAQCGDASVITVLNNRECL